MYLSKNLGAARAHIDKGMELIRVPPFALGTLKGAFQIAIVPIKGQSGCGNKTSMNILQVDDLYNPFFLQ
jgi:hypothetical protein